MSLSRDNQCKVWILFKFGYSEDIDLILDWRVLGYTVSEPWAERSKTSQEHSIN